MGEGQLRVIIYINLAELRYILLHAKFHDYRTISYIEDFEGFYHKSYGHGSHLGHVTWIIYINFPSPYPRRLHMKFGIDWPSNFREYF